MQKTGITGASYYPELYDKPHNGKTKEPVILTKCTTFFIKGACPEGHSFLKALVCGREWCEECGVFESHIHQRRIARWFGRVMVMKKMGYLVITVPDVIRDEFKDRKTLSKFRTYVKRKLQRMGYNRGLIRYHWAGDCFLCRGKGGDCDYCQGTGAGKAWQPHLNVLIEEGYLSKPDFEKKFVTLKKDVAKWFKKQFKKEVQGNLFYSYASNNAHRVHKLKYITRATWRFYNTEICEIISGYRTSSMWGKFEKCDFERASKLVSLEAGQCPCCGYEIKWTNEMIHRKHFNMMKTTHISAGYFLILAPNDS